MSSNLIKNAKNILNQYNIRPSKRLGQNFLIDKIVLNKIVKAADIKLTDVVLEIGPGTGVLTQELAKKAKNIIAVEKDAKMCEILKETLRDYENAEIINADILKIENQPYGESASRPEKLIENCKLKIENYKLVANLPYYITSPVIRKFLEIKNLPKLMVLMTQKEVAQRICAKPPRMNLLAVSVQFYAKPEIIDYVSKQCFCPQPKVDSAIIRISEIKKPRTNTGLFFKIVKAGFSQPRKKLVNNLLALDLTNGLKLKKRDSKKILPQNKEKIKAWLISNKISPNQRAEGLTISNWTNLINTFNKLIK